MYCRKCGNKINDDDKYCPHCGAIQENSSDFNLHNGFETYGTDKNKLVAAILAILLGDIGVHHFYMGNIGKGVLSVIFAWSGIPAICGFVMGIIYLCESDEKFASRINNK